MKTTKETTVPSTPADRESGEHPVVEAGEQTDSKPISRQKLKKLLYLCFLGDPVGYPKRFSHYVMDAVCNDLRAMGHAFGDDGLDTAVIERGLILAQGRLQAAIELDQLFFGAEHVCSGSLEES
ncbi:MAG TPA: hypothetical protein VK550_13515 [Polyangiaceae bacterium]|nr:hypothetical protein [Polyangiaceae bacterium]